MKGVGVFFKKSSTGIIVSLIFCFMLFMGIGYANLTKELNISGDMTAQAQGGLFISQANYASSQNVPIGQNYINDYYATIFNANIQLSETTFDSYVEFDIEVHNGYSVPYRYSETKKVDSVFKNNNITFEILDSTGLAPLERGVVVNPNESINFKIKFLYADSVDTTVEKYNIASACVNIDFNVYVQPVLTDNMIPVEYNQTSLSWQMAEEDSFSYADYDNGIWANAVTYDHSKAYSQNEYTTNGGTYFDGASYYIDYRNENYDFNHNLTVGARFKSDGTGSNSLGYIICNLESAGFGLFVTHINTTVGGKPATAGQVGFCYIVEDGTEYFTLSNTIVPMYTWATVVATYDGTNVKLYVNGVLDKVEAHTGDIKPSEAGVNVGRNPKLDNTGTFYFDGNISHVMLLNDTLTDAECKQVYDTRFKFPTSDHNEIFNLDITSRDVNGKYFDGKVDGGYNLGLANESFIDGDVTKMSIAVRFNIHALTEDNINYLACCAYLFGYGIGLRRDDVSGKCYLYFAFRNSKPRGFMYARGDELLDLHTWYTAVVTVDGYNIRMYLDGREQTLEYVDSGLSPNYNDTLSLVSSDLNLVLGGQPNNTNKIYKRWFNGWISECAVFRKALSQDEISRDFANDFAFHYKKYSRSPSDTDVAQYVKYDYDNIILQSENSYTEEGIELNGVDDYICVGLGNHDFSSSLTMAIRLKIPTISTGNKVLISNYEDGGFQLLLTDGKLRVMAKNRGSDGSVTTEDFRAEDFIVQANTWYTIAVVINSSGIHIFVDGVKIANITKDMNLANCMHPVFIGANPNPGNYTAMANIIVSDYAFINQAVESDVISQYFSGAISPSLARANCFLNFVGYEYRSNNQSIPDEIINGFYTWIPRFKVNAVLNSGEVDIELVSKYVEAHDAFAFNNVNVEGFWFSKFENSLDKNGQIQTTSNAIAYTTQNINEMFNKIKLIETSNPDFNANDYSMLNIHMAKNSEWGAMAYLSQSKYGLFKTGTFININANSSLITGYDYQNNTNQSTTQNITGIYDIVGGTNEYVMANYSNTIGNSGFESMPEDVYYDVYSSIESYYDSGLYHAMGEIDSYSPDDGSIFVSASNSWLVRTGLFDYRAATGEAGYSSRTVIAVVK